MSHEPIHQPHARSTIESYIIGFAASLFFTVVPYYLVRHHQGAGTDLLIAILGLALVQLIIQVRYFLHLGRGPKPHFEVYFFLATISMILVVVGGSLVIVNNLHSNMSVTDQEKKLINDEAISQVSGKLTGACQETHANHQVVFKNGVVSPRAITANKCDTLTFTAEDGQSRTITFGIYPAHDSYAGESEIGLRAGHTSETVTLSETGGFNFHDQQQPTISGSFLVIDDDQGSYN